MKKVLLFGGLALAGFGLYRYFKNQIELALSYEYALKDFKILGQTDNMIDVSAVFSITNKSSFQVVVKDYDYNYFLKTYRLLIQNQQKVLLFNQIQLLRLQELVK